MIEIINKIEKLIYAVLMIMLIVVLLTSLGFLVFAMYDALWLNTRYILDTDEMIRVLGAFLLVLIGVELLDTIKAYFVENTIHVEIVVLLAIIAVARKVILLEPPKVITFEYGFELMGIGVIVIGLAASYYLIKKAGLTIGPGVKKPE
ncbi:MAG: phosphate-starvation-inducible PsiE family protein [Methanoregula sp.]|nr:phosphate-starvation-inducible PsiE family protein [Methanoregula sp.]